MVSQRSKRSQRTVLTTDRPAPSPAALSACTVNRYLVSARTPAGAVKTVDRVAADTVTTLGAPVAAPLAVSRCRVTRYPVTADPPVAAGAVHCRVAVIAPPLPPRAADRLAGVPGTVRGVTGTDSADQSPVPAAFRARTRNRYAVPLTRPVTVSEPAVAAAVRIAPTWAPAAVCTWTS